MFITFSNYYYQTAFAAKKEVEVSIDDKMSHAVFTITWQNDKTASVELIRPDGFVLNSDNLKESYVVKDKYIAIFVDNPPLGKWKVRIIGEGLGKVSIELSEIAELIKINKFEISKDSTSSVFNISWDVSNAGDFTEYSIFADEDNSGYDGVEITTFFDKPIGNRKIAIDKLSYGNYYFYLRAKYPNKAVDYKYSKDSFLISNSNMPAELKNIKINLVDNLLNIKWDKPNSFNISSYKVMLFKKGSSKPFYFETVDENDCTIDISEQKEDFEVGVAGIDYSGIAGIYKKYPVSIRKMANLKADIGFPKKDYINTKRVVLPIKFDKGYKASIFVNGIIVKDNIKTSDNYLLTLIDGYNELMVLVEDDKGNGKTYKKKIYVDTYPPQLNFIRNYDNVKTSLSSFVISGDVEPNAALYINSKRVQLTESGVFNHPVKLRFGKNRIFVKAVDQAGNETIYNVIIIRQISKGLILMITFWVIAALSIGFMIWLLIKKINSKEVR